MSDSRRLPDDRPNSGPMPLIDQLRALEGEEAPEDQDAVLEPDEFERERGVTDTEVYLGEIEAGVAADRTGAAGDIESLEGLADRDLREGETDIAYVASDEGLTYVPPSDPPVVSSDDPQGIDVAGGDDDSPESELTTRVRQALRADAATAGLADRVIIATVGSTVVLRGTVDTIDDGDALVAVASMIPEIDEVRDETEVPGV